MAGQASAGAGASRPAPSTQDTFSQAYRRAGGSSAPTKAGAARWAGVSAATVDNSAGFVLALLFWGWVALPLLKGGPAAVKDTLRAKFFNRAPDGSWLP